MRIRGCIAILGACVLLAGCSGVASTRAGSAILPASGSGAAVHLTVRVPKRSASARRARYISASTKSLSLSFAGPSTVSLTIGLTPGSAGCTSVAGGTQCTTTFDLRPGSYTATIGAYDAAPIGGAIPPGAHLLSSANAAPFSVAAGKANQVGITLEGVPATVLVGALPSATFGMPFASPQSFSVTVLDADRNTIVGTYSNAIALTDSDSIATSVVTSGPDSPPAQQLLSSSDGAALTYNGDAIAPATISASVVGDDGSSQQFAPANVLVVELPSDDLPNPQTPGLCPGGANGELRYEMCKAQPGDAIVFDCGPPCTIHLQAPLPPIEGDLTIDGGAFGNVVLDGANEYRGFYADNGNVVLKNLMIQHVAAQGGNGADGGGGGAGLGGGLFVNAASVTLANDFFLSVAAIGGNGGAHGTNGGGGGGLFGVAGGTSDGTGGGGGGAIGPGGNGQNNASGVGGAGVSAQASGGLQCSGGAAGNGMGGGNGGGGGGGGYCPSSGADNGGNGGAGGFGGGGGGGGEGAAANGGNGGQGGFGGGGGGGARGGSAGNGGAGGAGGGGGGAAYGGANGGAGGVLVAAGSVLVAGGKGGDSMTTSAGDGGGGAAAGPAIFVYGGSLTITNSGASGITATGGVRGGATAYDGAADATPVFNFGGTINGNLGSNRPARPASIATRKTRP